MSLFRRIKDLFKAAPGEQIVGYSVVELTSIFGNSFKQADVAKAHYPVFSSLGSVGIRACYSNFVIDRSEVDNFRSVIGAGFSLVDERAFTDLTIERYRNHAANENLILSISYKEFNVATVRLVIDSAEVMDLITKHGFSVPPPWVAFEGYDPAWWGGEMQGAQGYYNDHYFGAFFSRLEFAERNEFYGKYSATADWVLSLESTLER